MISGAAFRCTTAFTFVNVFTAEFVIVMHSQMQIQSCVCLNSQLLVVILIFNLLVGRGELLRHRDVWVRRVWWSLSQLLLPLARGGVREKKIGTVRDLIGIV